MRMRFARRRAKKAGRSPNGQATGMPRDDQGRRQSARIVDGQPEDGYTSMFEIICCDRGDHPDRDYPEVPPSLQRIRRPYPIAAGVETYVKQLKRHPS